MSSTLSQTLGSLFDPLLFEPRGSPPWPHQPAPTHRSPWNPDPIYVHPLTTRSLEMCTESLGSETGNDIVPGFDEIGPGAGAGAGVRRSFGKEKKRACEFPPPLTSISGGGEGGGVVQVRAHREGGRLVIRAFNVSSSGNFFRAERENGRLRLSLVGGRERDGFLGEEREKVEERGEIEGRHRTGENGGKIGCVINGGDWPGSRCNEERGGRSKSIPSLPFCVAIS